MKRKTIHNVTKIKPLIGPEKNLPEITIKATILAIILIVILCAGNAYLGLKVGTTISASIPAAVISMGILRFFKHSNILENNIVQTAASVGESTAAGVAFVLPALLLIHYWTYFHFWGTLLISLLGGMLGMLFSIPIRRVILNRPGLRFPEGTAIGAVLIANEKADSEIKPLLFGGLAGAVITLFQSGFQIVADSFQYWFSKGSTVYGFGVGLSPALLAAGYIVGVNVAISMLIGVVLGWVIGMPLLSHAYPVLGMDPTDVASSLWNSHIRHIGVGTMLVGGAWTIITLVKPLYEGVVTSLVSVKRAGERYAHHVIRTERDIPIHITGLLILFFLTLTYVMFYYEINPAIMGIGPVLHASLALAGTVFILVGGFLFSSISAYFAGLIGSTNSPASGLLVASIMLFSIFVLVVFGVLTHFSHSKSVDLAAFSIMVCAIIGPAITISNDTMQDLKAGQIVGATPWKQQVILILGVVVASFVIAPVLQLLFNAYGIGGVFPRPGMPHADMLSAPQAGLMAAVSQGVFTHEIPWLMVAIGGFIAFIGIIIDELLKRHGKRLPVLAVGLGIYLPLASSMPVVLGGFLALFAHRSVGKKMGTPGFSQKSVRVQLHRALLLACGIVAGASLMGVILAIPFAIDKSADALKLVSDSFQPYANALGAVSAAALLYWLYAVVTRKERAQ